MKIRQIISAFVLALSLHAQAKSEFVHPGVIHNAESISFTKQKIKEGKQPWARAWARLKASRYADLDWKPQPHPHVERGPYNQPDIGSSAFTRDSKAAYTHALAWALTDKKEHAKKSAQILDAWSSTLESVTNHDAALLIGMNGQSYITAAEILKHTSKEWPQKSQERFADLIRTIWLPVIKDFYPTANGNWDAAMLQTTIAMGVFLDDRALFERATHYYLEGEGNGAIRHYFKESGQCQESGRDQGHTQMGLEFLSNTCETAWIQGVDLYGAFDNRLLAGFEYTAKYNLGFDVPYKPFRSVEGRYHYKSISDDSRGRLRAAYEKVYNHYTNRRQLEAPHSKQAAHLNRLRSRWSASLPWETLMFAHHPASLTTQKDSSEDEPDKS